MKDFIFDLNDYRKIPGLFRPWDGERPFLVPVFFEKNVLTRYLYDPAYRCEFCSETYGTIYSNGDYISFGINPNGLVIMWLGDIDRLEEKEKLYLLSHNVPSDHDIHSEFYDAQINVKFTDPIKEVDLLVTKNKLNEAINKRFKFRLFQTEYPNTDTLFSACSKYKKLLLGGEDDFKRIISEWNEFLVEDIDVAGLKSYLRDAKQNVDNLKSIKLLEKFIEIALGMSDISDKLMLPYYALYNLRIWADHRNSEKKYFETLELLGLDKNIGYLGTYQALLERLLNFHNNLLVNLTHVQNL